ncbi:MAG: extracellular solute-binding protein family 1, partial [Bacteroidetes bacterium]|nr:extracellular solute-binding protein family 1 [Bacteroidota bacterium]
MRAIRSFAGAFGFFLVLVGLLPAIASAQAKPVSITFWDAEPADLVQLRMQILKGFEAKYPNIKVNYLNIPYAEARQKLVTAAATKTLPDTMFFQATWL